MVKRWARRASARPTSQDAIDIGPHRKSGAVLLPGVDVAAYAEEVTRLRERVEELEEDLKDAGLALFLQERPSTTSGERLIPEQS